MPRTTLFRQHPWPIGHRRLMPYMLPVSAGKIRHPVAMLILVITDNRLIHPSAVQSRPP